MTKIAELIHSMTCRSAIYEYSKTLQTRNDYIKSLMDIQSEIAKELNKLNPRQIEAMDLFVQEYYTPKPNQK